MLFHCKPGYLWKPGTPIPANQVQPVMFLSRCLNNTKMRYRPSELEVACLVWTVKRAHIMLHNANSPVIVLTDHSATKGIVEQTSLRTTSTDGANKRLINVSIYLSQFDLKVYHLPDKKNLISDTLSRLRAKCDPPQRAEGEAVLDLGKNPSELPVLPDYEAEFGDVLERATLMCIRSSEDLSFLPAVQDRTMRSSATIPSWVVDWPVAMAPVPLMTVQLINSWWNPSNGMPLEPPDTEEPGILKFRAAKVCMIEQVSLGTDQLQKDMDLSNWVDLVLEMDVPYGADTGQGLTEVLWRTVIADTAWDKHPAPVDFGHAFVHNYIGMVICRTASDWTMTRFERELEDMVRHIQRLRSVDPASVFPDGDEMRRLARMLKGEDLEYNNRELLIEAMGKIEQLGQHMNRVCVHRRLARTDFNFLSLVPMSTEAGDSIWILPGMSTPFVFREMPNGNVELLGEAYVHGIMFGEAMDGLELTMVRLQ